MNKILYVLAAALLIAGCAPKEIGPVEIVILHSGDTTLANGSTLFGNAEAALLKDYPKAKITWSKIDLSDGSTLTMDAMLAAGTAPNVYIDTMVRASKYMVADFALPLDGQIRDLNKYNPGVLDPYRKDGKLLALPVPGGAQAMCINLDIMADIGYTVPANWTIQDFKAMADLVKAKYAGTKWATGMFAANQSGDYLINAWYATFGVNWYAGSYDMAKVADNGGDRVYEWYQTMARNEWIPPNAATLNDDDYAAQWYRGQLAATAFFPNWTAGYFKTAEAEGLKPFNYTFVPFPRAEGVTKVPTYNSNGAMVVHKTGTDADIVAARLVEYINSARLQGELAKVAQVIPNRSDATAQPTDPHVQEVVAIVREQGLQDVGITDSRFTERRSLQFPILQQILTFKMTPKDGISLFQQKLTAVSK